MNARPVLLIASALGLSSVAIGAASDHTAAIWGLSHIMQVALHYQQLYAIVIGALGLALTAPHWSVRQRALLGWTAWAFIAGTLCFCGGLYVALDVPDAAYLAPVGGFLLMGGWAGLGLMAFLLRRPPLELP